MFSFQSLQNARLLFFVTALGSLGVLESLRPVRVWQAPRWKRWGFHAAVSIVNTILTRLTVAFPLFFLMDFLQQHSWGLSHMFGLRGGSEVLTTFILFDGLDYWWHRWNHQVPFLWRFHRVHHVDTHVDVTTSLRFHPGELFLSYFAKTIWIFFWGPSILGYLLFETGISAYSQFHHSNIDFSDPLERKLRWIHMTPRVHASHHTVSLRSRDANFSTIFLVWDRIFKTFREPDFEEMKQLGLPEGRDTYLSPLEFLTAPFKRQTGTEMGEGR